MCLLRSNFYRIFGKPAQFFVPQNVRGSTNFYLVAVLQISMLHLLTMALFYLGHSGAYWRWDDDLPEDLTSQHFMYLWKTSYQGQALKDQTEMV